MSRWRLLVAEAAVRLIVARVLVAQVPLARWRGLLGNSGGSEDRPTDHPDDGIIAEAVDRAAVRIGGTVKCLPRAIALHWMLRRRGRPATLVLAVLPGQARGGVDDLHAWVARGEAILIGASELPYRPVARFGWSRLR